MKFPLTKTQKLLMLAVAVLPIVFFAIYFFSFFLSIDGMFRDLKATNDPQKLFNGIWSMMMPMMLGGISQLLMFILYLLHAIKNPRLQNSNDRLVWVLVIILASVIGCLIYWYLQIWKEEETPSPSGYSN